MDDKAVEAKLERILWNAQRALEVFDVPHMPEDMKRIELMRRLNIIIAASQPFATRWLNFIPDPIDQPDRGDEEKEAAKEPDGSEGHDYDAMGNEAGMDDTYVPGPPTPGCPF